MPRRKGIWERLRDWWSGKPTPPAPPPPPPPPTPPGPPGPPPDREEEYREEWREITDTSPRGRHAHIGSFDAHFELFDSLPGMTETPEDEKHELWELYLRVMVNGDAIRNDPTNGWWGAMGIHPTSGAFDWDEFRSALGYSRRH